MLKIENTKNKKRYTKNSRSFTMVPTIYTRFIYRNESITNLLEKESKLKWENDETTSFKRIVDKIERQITLKYPDIRKHFYLECDASSLDLGSVLKQEHGINGFYSYKL